METKSLNFIEQNIVYVIDAVNKANDLYGKKCKAILATQAKP